MHSARVLALVVHRSDNAEPEAVLKESLCLRWPHSGAPHSAGARSR